VTRPTIIVHGGAGGDRHDAHEDEKQIHAALAGAVRVARTALDEGAPALDAVQRAVEALEACPLFNAGTGSVLTSENTVEMDAALMCGTTGRAGAVAAVKTPRHPIALARAVLDDARHVMLVGEGADRFAAERGVETVDPARHVTERRRRAAPGPTPGTVGAVVLDRSGGLAAATSTGGTAGQHPGRVGDSPLIGAGTYACRDVAISASGHGEALIRVVAAHQVAALMLHAGMALERAASTVIEGIGSDAGLIAVGPDGSIALPFNCARFNRGWQVGDEPISTRTR
jgi:beta-aspartyl-peptidase (threonine type)